MVSQNSPVGELDAVKTDKPLLSLDVAVFDPHGNAVSNLNRSDFVILDDGVPQKIGSFTPADTPYSVLLLLDCGDETRDRLNLLADAVAGFRSQLRPEDRMEIAIFGSEVQVVRHWSSEGNEKIRVGDNPICMSTDLYNALDWSTKEVRKVSGRQSVVVFSNGHHTTIRRQEMQINGISVQRIVPAAKDTDFQKILKAARETGAPFHFVAVDTDLNPGNHEAGPVQDLQQLRARVEQLAEVSGGRVVYPRESSEVVPLFLQIGRNLGVSYSLAFTPQHTKDGSYHSIDVQVRDENYRVMVARKSYTAN